MSRVVLAEKLEVDFDRHRLSSPSLPPQGNLLLFVHIPGKIIIAILDG